MTQERILEAALGLLDRDGFEGLTVRSLAERLGVTPMAIYRHFEGKQALIDAILDRATSEIALPPPELALREALAAIAREIRATVLRHAPLVPALASRPSLDPAPNGWASAGAPRCSRRGSRGTTCGGTGT